MDDITYYTDDGIFTVCLPERVDTSNADKLREDILKNIAESGCTRIVIDCENTNYVSSAGLRIFMAVSKRYEDVHFANVTGYVKEVLDITGFLTKYL